MFEYSLVGGLVASGADAYLMHVTTTPSVAYIARVDVYKRQVQALLSNYAGDAKTGVQIILRALEEPIRQIAANAGIDGSVIVENIKNAKKPGYGFDALKGCLLYTSRCV